MSPRRLIPVALVLALASAAVVAADWPQWRGPARDGKSPDTGLAKSWPAGGPPLAFRVGGLGAGYASVAVVSDRVYTLGDSGGAQYALAIDGDGKKIVWKTKIGPAHDDRFLGPRSTPTVAGDRVFVMSTSGDLVCLDAKTGEIRWQKSLPRDLGGKMMKAPDDWKFSESPLVDGDRVIVTPGAADAALVALDRETGKLVWRARVPALGDRGTAGAAYSSVVVSEAAGKRQYVQLLGTGVVGVDAATGEFLWGYNRIANDVANIPTPIVHGDHVFTSTGYGTGAALLRIAAGEGGFEANEVYFLDAETMQNHHGGMILHDGVIYTGTGHNKGFPLAVHMATGKIAWGPVRNDGQSSAAVSFADGRLYYRYQDGLVLLVEATPEAYREHGSLRIPDVERESWPHPAIANGKLYLREQDTLHVYDLRAPKP
jgi:outer membrane protein assembly factor BamB